MDAFEQGDLEKAAEIFKQAIAAAPENSEAHAGLGKVLVRQENFPDGIEELKLAVKYDPADPAPYYVLGFALRAIERNVEASDAYEKFLKLAPDALDGAKMRDWVTRIKGAAAAPAAAHPAGSGATPAAGAPSSGAHSTEDTYVDDEQIVTETDKRYKTALTQFQEGGVDTALRDCVKILNEDPGHFRTRVLLGRIYMRQKAFDNAIEQLEGAQVTRPDYPEALYFLGQACEKRGSAERAAVSYSRYLEVAPQGPRAERLREWLQGHQSDAGTASQMQCELCLRFFPGSEITQHEGKATCRNCLVVMGAAPSAGSTLAPPKIAPTPAAPAEGAPPASGGKRAKLVAAAVLLVALGAAGLNYKKIMEMIKGKTAAVGPVDPGSTKPPPPVDPSPDTSKIKIAGDLKLQVHPYAPWSYTVALEGIADVDEKAKGWTAEYILSDHPPGMELKDKTLTWLPSPTDFAALKAEESYPVKIAVRGSWKRADGTSMELFSVARPFTLKCQFGYDVGTEQDLGLPINEPLAVASADIDGDGQPDLLVAWGQFRRGGLRLFINRGSNQFGAPAELTSGKSRNSAVWCGALEGEKTGVLAANWMSGDVVAYYIENNQPVKGGSLNFGPGPVALTAARFDDPKTLYVAALLGVARSLAIAPLTGDRKFGSVVKVPLPSNGGPGFVFPWTSAELGPGFVAVTPLSDTPIQFVAYNKGAWKVTATPVDLGLISAAAVLRSGGAAGKGSSLALAASSGHTAQVVVFEEQNGKFSASGKPIALPTPALGLAAADYNLSGRDDLFIILADECLFYFNGTGATLFPGPLYKPGKMNGTAAVLPAKGGLRPALFLLNENGKAVILKPVQ
jgi:Flp pilus assembly protein TadD